MGHGARALAGEEERGTLELLLVTPVSGSRIVADKALALALSRPSLPGRFASGVSCLQQLHRQHVSFTAPSDREARHDIDLEHRSSPAPAGR
ncbi:ABC transporter permease subunit [Kribbella sp. NBC_00889]|uniref:ABC transporter permease subunit n=1 Tax=Kribbella sp. NBC_00889 TaxID=2975974 RepID=UPI003865C0D1